MRNRLGAVKPFILLAPILGMALSGCIVGGSAAPKKVPTPARVAAVVPTATPLPDPSLEPLAARLVAVRTITGSGVGQIAAALNAEAQQLPDSVRIDFSDAQAQFEIARRVLSSANASGSYVPPATTLRDAVAQYLDAAQAYARGSSAAGKEAAKGAHSLSAFDRDLALQPEAHVASVAAAAQVIVTRAERVKPRIVRAPSPHRSKAHRTSHRTVHTPAARPQPTVSPHATTRFAVVTPTPKPTRTPLPAATATPVPTPRPTAPPRPTSTPVPTQPADQPASVLAAQAVAQATMQALARTVTVALPVSHPAFNTAHRVSNRLHTALGLTQEFHATGDPRIQVRLDQIQVLIGDDLETENAKLSALGQRWPRAAAFIRAAVTLERRAVHALSLAESNPAGAAPYATLMQRASVRLGAAERDLQSAKTILAG